jgi:integrase
VIDQRKRGEEVEKVFATAHDLRRAFGFRWSRRVMPAVLHELMRYESVETTMRYYVGTNAEATADELWKSVEGQGGNTLGNTPATPETADSENP